VIGVAIGAFIGGISLAFGGAFLYKWNKNKNEDKKVVLIPENEKVNDTNHEILEIPAIRNINNHGQEIISATPAINNVYKHKMLPKLPIAENSTNNEISNETTPSTDNQGSSLQNIDVLENFKNEMLQVIKQEVQDLKQEFIQNKEQVSNININK